MRPKGQLLNADLPAGFPDASSEFNFKMICSVRHRMLFRRHQKMRGPDPDQISRASTPPPRWFFTNCEHSNAGM